jgi:multidrug resistance efflux pump
VSAPINYIDALLQELRDAQADGYMLAGSQYAALSALVAERDGLLAELAAAQKQRDEALRDAERYRWLKSDRCDWVEIRSKPSGYLIFQGRHGHAFLHHSGNAEMDDVIDSAMRRGKA